MGLLDSVLGGLGGGGGDNPLLSSVMQIVNDNGGIGGLAEKFQQGGLGELAKSWISTGENLPISAEQLQSVLGSDQLSGLAEKFGMNSGDLSSKLSEYLPQVIDKLTPNGEVPQGDMLSSALEMLKGKLG
ncbi:MAG: DUF937 domain-containing protein [Betaproteobacteria bacterium]|nr:DUF937 domain-containing protein [Betaproteobacteria bacterium]